MNRFLQYVEDKLNMKPEGLRSSQWNKVQKNHLKKEPVCQWCNSSKKLDVHHILPFHLHPKRELDGKNLITLCKKCHLVQGHYCNWKLFDKYVKIICGKYRRLKNNEN